MENKQSAYLQEDEIDLRELIKTVAKHKKFVVIFTSIVTLLAAVYAFLQTPVYEVKSNIQIGFIGKSLVASPQSIKKTLSVVFNVGVNPNPKKKFISKVKSISQNKNVNNFIEVVTDGISNAEALKKSNEVLTYLQDLYAGKILQYKAVNLNRIKDLKFEIQRIDTLEKKNLEQQISIIKTQKIPQIDEKIKLLKNVELKTIKTKLSYYAQKLNEYNKEIRSIDNQAAKSTNETSVMIASIQMVNYQNIVLNLQNTMEGLKVSKEKLIMESLPSLKREKENLLNGQLRQLQFSLKYGVANKKMQINNKIQLLKYNISSQNIQNSSLVGKNIIQAYPVKPKKKLIVVVAFVAGLIVSVFLVFFLEFIKTFKEEQS